MTAGQRKTFILAAWYAALAALAFLSYATAHVHVGALAVIPILFISYYVRPYVAVATAFVAGIALGLIEGGRVISDHVFDLPPIADALILSLSLCAIVVVANRMRQMSTAYELLHGSLVKARQAAERDTLTGIVNRAYFLRALHDAGAQADVTARAAVLFCDLDGFKKVNDLYGHAVGDTVLRMAASRLVNAVRAVDVVARLGGDEFGILVRWVHDVDEAARMAANIERAFKDPFHAEQERHEIGITVGISICPDDGTDPDTLLRVADARMYRSKEEKRVARR